MIVQNEASGVDASKANIFQGTSGGAAEGSQASITQTGSVANAGALIAQGVGVGSYSSGDMVTITQRGKNVSAIVNQDMATLGGLESNGRNNQAMLIQDVGVNTGRAIIQQGMAVNGNILQTNRNLATINQVIGTGLRANITQGGSDDTFTDVIRNPITINGLDGTPVRLVGAVSNDNTASITQTSGDNHNANLFQNGRFNTASVAQSNGNGHQALVVQTANSQRALATITQTSAGTGNFATILQFAGSNADGQGQYGNMASINQVAGSNNVAFVQQGLQGSTTSSNDNQASITQNGNNNQVLNLAGDPGSYGSQQGYNNRLMLVQEGGNTGVIFKYTQIGNNNTQVVNQHF